MNFKGKIVWVSDIQNIPTKDGRIFLKREAVIETTGDRYAQSLCFEVFGDDVNHQFLQVGQDVEVEYNMNAISYKDKHYNRARAWKISLQQKD